ncbi:hypothetical protein DL98DRAFT_303962 [Cadophora sp. DSE1049]|nr:hypothetical protein DL98DRAFT_303962 [Cadophora sp. DSE1049]
MLKGSPKHDLLAPTAQVGVVSSKHDDSRLEMQQLHKQSNLGTRSHPPTLPPPEAVRAYRIVQNLKILVEATQQLKKILSGMGYCNFIAPEILAQLNCRDKVLLSCTTVVVGRNFATLAGCQKPEDWAEKEREDFCFKFSGFVRGSWTMGDILGRWEEFFKVLTDKIEVWQQPEACWTKVSKAGCDFGEHEHRLCEADDSQENRKDVATFCLLPNELRYQIWEESFSQQRIFDDDTLRLLNPQDGIMYSYLTPYALFVCRDSREYAQRRLRCSYLSEPWSDEPRRRVIYFNPDCDVRIHQFGQFHWRRLDGQCLFSCVKIIADVSPADLTSDIGYGLRSVEFREKFPNLKRVTVTDRRVGLNGEFVRYMWTGEQWNRESSANKNNWDRDWKAVEKLFEGRGIRIEASSDVPETNENKKRYIKSFQACPVTLGRPAGDIPAQTRTSGWSDQ